MDILKKMFERKGATTSGENAAPPTQPNFGNDFRKPVWFDDCETDDELYDSKKKVFGFQIFTNPLEMQKHFEQQMEQVLKSLEQFENGAEGSMYDENVRENYMKPGFENFFRQEKAAAATTTTLDSDLDGEIYADQLHSLLQRVSPEMEALMTNTARLPQKDKLFAKAADASQKRTDEETIWDRIHGATAAANTKAIVKKLQPPRGGGIFEGAFQGPKVFRQSVMTQMVRKPDGSYESRRTVVDADGHANTTITRTTADGRTETIMNSGGGAVGGGGCEPPPPMSAAVEHRNIYVTKEGYAMPKNIW